MVFYDLLHADYIGDMRADFGACLEGRTDDELPERMLWAFSFEQLGLFNRTDLAPFPVP